MQMSQTLARGLGHGSQPLNTPERPSRCLTRQVCGAAHHMLGPGLGFCRRLSIPHQVREWVERGPHRLLLLLRESPLAVGLLCTDSVLFVTLEPGQPSNCSHCRQRRDKSPGRGRGGGLGEAAADCQEPLNWVILFNPLLFRELCLWLN